MPRAIVMIRGEDTTRIRDVLTKLTEDKLGSELYKNNGVIFEYFMDCFGWFDFVASLWGSNIELLELSIERIRELSNAYTSTLIGISPGEKNKAGLRLEEILKEYAKESKGKAVDPKKFLHESNLMLYVENLEKYAKKMRDVRQDTGK